VRKIIVTLVFTCAFILQIKAQVNYVLNPSFEQHGRCPYNYDQVKYANFWNGVDTTWDPNGADSAAGPYCLPEYCNSCSNNTCCGLPFNARFHKHSRTGDGMTQVTMYFDESYTSPVKRDYLQGRLHNHLNAGANYCVSFFVNFTGTDNAINSGYAVDHIGAYLDDGSIDTDTGAACAMPIPTIIPQVYTTTIITDTLHWTKIQGSFIATGNERFITIGNFFDKAHTNVINYNLTGTNNFSWYLVDDVSVIESTQTANAGPDVVVPHGDSVHIGTSEEGMPCTWYKLGSSTPIGSSGGIWVRPNVTTQYVVEMDLCGNVTRDTVKVAVDYTKAPSFSPQGGVMVYPNPAANELVIEHAVGSEVVMIDVVGRVVYHSMLATAKEILDVHGLQKGVYVVQIIDVATGYRVARKVVKE
jgi:hypothetical protein